ncbi:hypothetical protein Ancab_020369 [Ancistrocladus abbreviatus]
MPLQRKLSNAYASDLKFQRLPSLVDRPRDDLSNHTLVFNVEESLLKSSSLFPYFMLVAFEAGSPLRALVLLALYPLICLVGKELGMKMMVMVCFFGIKKESFQAGIAVLPKFFLEDVGLEVFEAIRTCKRTVGVSDMPRVMVEGFLRNYFEVDHVVGREIKEFHGYFVGVMEEKKKGLLHLKEIVGEQSLDSNIIGICGSRSSSDHPFFSACKEICLISKAERSNWHTLPRDKYPRPMIFHDGRLVCKPSPATTVAIFMWAPFAVILAFIRLFLALCLPLKVGCPILAFSGLRFLVSQPKPTNPPPKTQQSKGLLYACNHRTLLDPVCLKIALQKQVTAVTYSVSRTSEILSPMKTVRLTRDRKQDAMIMDKLLNEGNLAICPEGTTCREPYLLRFSPLFAEMSDDIVPVAMDSCFAMFYANTAGGLKCLDPFFFLMDPYPSYTIRLLEKVKGLSTCQDGIGRSKFDVANYAQSEIGKTLGFECTRLTRRDKYLILTGNDGVSCREPGSKNI